MKPHKFLWRLASVFAVIAAVYFSWKSSPSISSVAWIPKGLGQWCDQHDDLKNFLAFGILAFVGLTAFGSREERPVPVIRYFWPVPGRDRKLLMVFGAIVLILELGQLLLPKRTCDLADILVGWIATLLAWPIYRLSLFAVACWRWSHRSRDHGTG